MPIVRSGDADISYEVAGDGDAVLLIMGLGTDSRMWMLQTPAIASRHRAIVFDNRGTGGSSSPPGPYSTEAMAADALAVLDAAGAERAHVVGISMGGAIAQQLALKEPGRVRSLTLAATWGHANDYLRRMADVGRAILASGGPEMLLRSTLLWLFTPRMFLESPEMIAGIEALALQVPPNPDGFLAQLDAVLAHDPAGRLASIEAPTLVLAAERDILVPRELSERLAATIPGARLEMLPGGHAFNVESADAFNREMLEFLAKT